MGIDKNEKNELSNGATLLLRHCIMPNPKGTLTAESYINIFLSNIKKPEFMAMIRSTPLFVEGFFELISECNNRKLLREVFYSIVNLHSSSSGNSPLAANYLMIKVLNELPSHYSNDDLSADDRFEYVRACLFKEDAMAFFKNRTFNPKNFFHHHLNIVFELELHKNKNIDDDPFIREEWSDTIDFLETEGYKVTVQDPNLFNLNQGKKLFFDSCFDDGLNENIWVDEENLRTYADDLENRLRTRILENIGLEGRSLLTIEDILATLQEYVNELFLEKVFLGENKNIDDIVEHESNSRINFKQTGKVLCIVPLSKYVEAQVGVCRHRALFDAFLLSSLIKKGYLNGTVTLASNPEHVWVNLAVHNSHNYGTTNYLVDTYNLYMTLIGEEQILDDTYDSANKLYGFKTLFNITNQKNNQKCKQNLWAESPSRKHRFK